MPIPSWDTRLTEVAPGCYAYTQAGGPGADNASVSGAGLIVQGDNIMAIDALFAPVQTKAFIEEIRRVTRAPVKHLVNTHHHVDHITGNCFFEPAEIIAHERCREVIMESGLRIDYVARKAEWQPGIDELRLASPTTTFEGDLTLRYGDLEMQLLYAGPAHTVGDVMVYLPQHKLLYAGDIAFYYVVPLAMQGHISGWIDAIDRVWDLDVETIVPGHGPIGTRTELTQMRGYLSRLKQEVTKRYQAELSPAEAITDLDMGDYDTWNNPERLAPNVLRMYQELRGAPFAALDESELAMVREAWERSRK
jgi:cyclase